MPTRSTPRSYPVRQVSRLVTELHLTGVGNARLLGQRRYERGILISGLARQSLPDWFSGDRLRRPRALTCFTSISALAASFGRPFETMRQHVRALVDEGTCVEEPRGVAISSDPQAAAKVLPFLRATHDTVLAMVEQMAGLGLMPRPPAPSDRSPTRAITGVGLDLQLMPFESLRDPMPDWTVLLVWGVVGGLCVRHVTTDPELSARYAHDSTPDEVRRPVTLRAMAAASGLPYSSTWRHAKTLQADGRIQAKGDGYIVGTGWLRGPAMEERTIAAVDYFRRRLADLIRLGLDPAEPMPWLRGRPPLLTG